MKTYPTKDTRLFYYQPNGNVKIVHAPGMKRSTLKQVDKIAGNHVGTWLSCHLISFKEGSNNGKILKTFYNKGE